MVIYTSDMSDSDQIDQHTSAEVSLDLAADIDQVWNALVTDGGLEPWMGSGATIDPRPDGALEVPDIVGGLPRRGLVHTVEDRARLGFTWWPEHRPIERSNVSITLTRTDTGTRITVTESPDLVPERVLRPGFQLPSSASARAGTPAGVSTEAQAMTVPSRVGGASASGSAAVVPSLTSSLRGCWSWRLAVLALAGQMAWI